MTSVEATYFDGRQAAAHAVTLSFEGDRVVVTGQTVSRDDPFGSVVISERIGRTPRLVRFADQAFCEVTDVETFQRLLAGREAAHSALSTWEGSGRVVGLLAVTLLLAGVAGYVYGLPWLVKAAADRMPQAALVGLSEQVLEVMDGAVFQPSGLPTSRQDALRSRFAAVRWPGGATVPMQIEFRKSEALGSNAMALPSGLIVVTDGLVNVAHSDEEILAVLAHEGGHAQQRHGLRNIIQSSIVSLAVTWFIGDVGGLVAAAPTALLESKYSRDLEREADAYAAATLTLNGLRASLLADMLERMEQERSGGTGRLEAAMAYLSSHPTTAERLARLRSQ
jgi:Zn-dependent protease with chaperone function